VTNEIYYMTKLSGGSGIYKMTKTVDKPEIYMMHRPDSTLPEGGGGGGGGGGTITWVSYGDGIVEWYGEWASPYWTSAPGTYIGGGLITLPAGYTKFKAVYVSDHWHRGDDAVTVRTDLGVKSNIQSGGFGSTITTDSTRRILVGNYTPYPPPGSGIMFYTKWMAV
jgi:hypothetical protein